MRRRYQRGRPHTTLTVYIYQDVADDFTTYCSDNNVNKSMVLGDLLKSFLAAEKKNENQQ
jgi:hypothetical protein